MPKAMVKRLPLILGILLTLSFLLGWLAQSVLAVGQREDYYLRSFEKYQVWEDAGISKEDALRIARALPKYLTGDGQALSLQVTMDDDAQPAFHAEELSHMQDVYRLFQFAECLLLCCAGLFALCTALVLLRREMAPAETLWRAALWTVAGAAACFVILALWAVIDFSSFFLLFHRIAFRNDLWLMNPETDLMIRLMPQGMFADGALRIGLWFAGGLGCFLLAMWGVTHFPRKKKEVTP